MHHLLCSAGPDVVHHDTDTSADQRLTLICRQSSCQVQHLSGLDPAGCSALGGELVGGICPYRITGLGVQTAAVITPHVASWVGQNTRGRSAHTEVEGRITGS